MTSSDEDSRAQGAAGSAERARRASSLALVLYGADPAARHEVLSALKDLYVVCESGRCVTDAAVAREVLPHAKRALADPDPQIRVAGARAIELLATDAADAMLDLAAALVDPVGDVRLAALEALCEAGEGASSVAAQIAACLTQAPSVEERSAAAVALGNSGAQADHVDALLGALVYDVPAVQASAAHALGAALDDSREDRRERVSNALRRLSATPPARRRND